MRHRSVLRRFAFACLVPGFLLSACSGSSGGSSGLGFQLTRISLLEDAVWKVNQEIVFTFSEDVDFSTVSSNTISIQTTSGTPATGTFFLRGTDQVVFQPTCPARADLSDTGLMAGGEAYVIRVLGRSSGASNTVRSTGGVELDTTQVRNFTTEDFGQEFLDTNSGPPNPIVRAEGSAELNATYLEVGGDPDPSNRVYFERDVNQDLVLSVPGFTAPLNLYASESACDAAARLGEKLAVVIEFNQALNPAASNISSSRMRLEFLDGVVWQPLETVVTLVANCTQSGGARVRLEPVGPVPRTSQIRAVVLVGLEDLTLNPTTAANETFAVAPTGEADFPDLNPVDALSDEFAESFEFGGTSPLSFQDTRVLSESPSASWGGGRLTAAFSFEGGGGPGGTFDWLVKDGDSILVDTDDGAIVASDDVTVQLFDDGVVNVRNMTIEQGGEVRVQGSKPLHVNATGTVTIGGTLDVSGNNAKDVSQLNTGDTVEIGGAGGPGGGRGGHANEVITNSTSRGGTGQGPMGTQNSGGLGGETGFAPAGMGKDARRPGGGAGGRFAENQGPGLAAEDGFAGSALASSALPPNNKPPSGGSTSSGPFVDMIAGNDFLGTKAVGSPGNVIALVHGELSRLWGGYGGGGGGNADPANVFPTPNWTPASDEKGGAGGGGGGGLSIRALGPIQFGVAGRILCNGGLGAIGENVLVQDHVGGNGGSGSGGHVVLETAAFIDFSQVGVSTAISAVGGAQRRGTTTSAGDVSFGGAGGPGVIQLHVPGPLRPPSTSSAFSGIVLSGGALGQGIDAVTSPPAQILIPASAPSSQARSDWISVGRADQQPGGTSSQFQFLFGGTNTTLGADEGKILVSDVDGDGDADDVSPVAPLLDEALEGNPEVSVLADRVTLRIDGATGRFPGANDLYLRNPALLQGFVVRLSVAAVSQDFVVASACYDLVEIIDVTVSDDSGDLQDFINANTALGTIHYQLVPRFFRVVTSGVENSLPTTSFVRIRFQAAAEDANGLPDETNLLVDWTGDISQFNGLPPGALQFFRFDVEFDLGTTVSSDTQPVSLDFLRIPFVF